MLDSLMSNFRLPVSSLHEAPAKKQIKGRDDASHRRCLDLGDGRLSGREKRPFNNDNAYIPLVTRWVNGKPRAPCKASDDLLITLHSSAIENQRFKMLIPRCS